MKRSRSLAAFSCLAAVAGASAALTLGARSPSPVTPKLSFSERTVAGRPSDLMVVRYLRLEGANTEIGEKLARVAIERHRLKADARDAGFAPKQSAWMKQSWPEFYARTLGVAKALGKRGDPTSIPYDMDFEPGCSVVFYPGRAVSNGHAMLSRNYDFPTGSYAEITGRRPKPGARSMTGDPYVIEMRPDNGFSALYVTSYDLLGCIDGVNEKGVAVALLADDMAESRHPSRLPGLSEVTLTRFVLDRCASAKEARKLLANVPYSYTFTPCHYIVCDATGDSFVWEITPDLKQRFIVGGKGQPQIVTNHRLSKFGTQNLPSGNSFDRFRRLAQEVAGRQGKLSPDEVRTVNACVAVPKEARGAATLWHSVYDLQTRSVAISFYLGKDASGERRTPYLKFGFTH